MLHEAQRTEAPRSFSVSISTAVWIVMCSEPVTRTPLSGLAAAYFLRIDIRPGISCSAMSISLRPQSASDRSATLKSSLDLRTAFIGVAPLCWRAPLRRSDSRRASLAYISCQRLSQEQTKMEADVGGMQRP